MLSYELKNRELKMNVYIGVGVIIIKNNKVLLGKRLNSHGHEQWAFPGGHLEQGETPEECAVRETLEETGLSIANPKDTVFASNFFSENQRHYVTLFMLSNIDSGERRVMEPDKCAGWQWFE